MSKETPKPVHKSFVNVSTDLTFTNLVAMEGELAYQDFQSVSSDLTFSTLKQSGYQYVLGTEVQETADDFTGSLDRASKIVRKTGHEFIGSLDRADTRPLITVEGAGSIDTASKIVTKTAHEFIGSLDDVNLVYPAPEAAGTVDRAYKIIRKTAHEFSGSTDTASFSLSQRQFFTTKIVGKVIKEIPFTTIMKSKALNSNKYTTYIQGLVDSLVGATATGGSNPFDPSVAIGGTTIIGGSPPPTNATTVYINIPNTGISTLPDWNRLIRYGCSWDYGGGSFNVASLDPPGALGSTIQIFGFNAIITKGGNAGFEYSSTLKGYNISGIFGAPKLNRQINLAVAGSIIAAPIVLNPALLQAQSNQWLTARSIAQIIGNICGVQVIWAANDVSVKDFSLEPGMKGIDVLQSMAQRVGATLRWFGNNTYYVAYPPKTIGSFRVPNQNLIVQPGISMDPLLDLGTGVAGTQVNQGMYTVPTISTTSSLPNGTAPAPNPTVGTNNPTVTQVAKISKLLTDDDPPMIFDLPYNYDQVYVQILIAPGQSTSGANGLGIQNFVTTNPQQVFLLSDTGFANTLIFNTLVGNAYIPQVKIDSRIMPENDAVQAGNFTLTVFCTLKDLGDAYEAAQDDANNNGSSVQLRNPLFVKTHEGKINCLFFGVIPLPGMYGEATVDDKTVSGVIENVTFTPSGILSLDIARYAAINFNQPYINWGTNESI